MAWFKSPAGPVQPSSDVGVLLVNLGTPGAPSYGAIRRFLRAFLGDRRVVEACPAYWYPILYGPILTLRPLRTRKLYAAIWTEEGSPLLVHSARLATRLQAALGPAAGVRVELAMTYGEPTIEAAIARLQSAAIRRLVVLPLYPQYSGSTTGSVFDRVMRELERWRRLPTISFIADYCTEPAYIEALAATVRASWVAHGRSHLVLSNHGIPVKYVAAGDPYRDQVAATTRALVAALGLGANDYSESFQSRFGRTTWLEPYTDDRLVELARNGVAAVTVITPSFAVDCLETLEEIGVASRAKFLAAGGREFHLVPALNDSAAHVAALSAVLRRTGL
ncbi:MAG TPA: ferrochelatase [Steroidobacteraceae bacterium]|nr:ferrochelatase [Steroidobacteraceae bacterium]